MRHHDELEILRYLDGEMPAERTVELQAHLEQCALCRELRMALERETSLLSESLQEADEMLPSRLQPGSSEELSGVFLGTVGLAAIGVYTLWNGLLLPWWQGLQSVGVDREMLLTVLLFKAVLWEGWSAMVRDLIQGGVTISSMLLVVSLARWSWRRLKPLTMAMVAAAMVLLSPCLMEAAVIELDVDNYVLPKDEVIDNDLIVTAESVRIEGTIEGDLIAAAQTVTVTGHIQGDILAFCQSLQVDGQVDGSVRSGSEFLDVNGRVGRNVTSGAERVQLSSDAVVEGSLTVAAARVNLDGRLGGDIIVAAESHSLNARVGGGALLASEQLTIGPAAEIQGEAKYYGAGQPEVSPQARLGRPLEVEIIEETPEYFKPQTYVFRLLKWAAAFIFGLVAFLLAPLACNRVLDGTARYGRSILVGAAAMLVVPVASLLVCLTLVGIPIGVAALFLFAAGAYGGQVFVGSWLGKEILGTPRGQGQALGQLALGLAVIHVVAEIPFVGGLASWIICFWGLGALVLSLMDRRPSAPVA